MRCLIPMIALLTLSLTPAAPAHAKGSAGDLDLSFGQRGKIVKAVDLEPEAWDSASASMARLSRNVTVVLVNKTLLAFRSDGRLASSFGGGRVEVAPPAPGAIRLSGITATPDGGLLVAGSYESPNALQPWDSVGEKAFLVRYLPDGTADPSFGYSGVLLMDFSSPPPTEFSYPGEKWLAPHVGLAGVAIDPLGRIVLTGRRMTSIGSCRAFGRFFYYEDFVARLQATGALDPTFAEGGVARVPEIGTASRAVVATDGGVYLPGSTGAACFPHYGLVLARLGSAGWPVSGFGDGGLLRLPTEETSEAAAALAIDRSDRVLLLNSAPESGVVYRITPTGQLDPKFGDGGRAVFHLNDKFSLTALTVDSHGRILVAGNASTGSFLVARLTARGRLDRRFGGDGAVQTRFGRRSSARATSVKLMPNGRILVAGPLSRPSLGGGEGLALAAYRNR